MADRPKRDELESYHDGFIRKAHVIREREDDSELDLSKVPEELREEAQKNFAASRARAQTPQAQAIRRAASYHGQFEHVIGEALDYLVEHDLHFLGRHSREPIFFCNGRGQAFTRSQRRFERQAALIPPHRRTCRLAFPGHDVFPLLLDEADPLDCIRRAAIKLPEFERRREEALSEAEEFSREWYLLRIGFDAEELFEMKRHSNRYHDIPAGEIADRGLALGWLCAEYALSTLHKGPVVRRKVRIDKLAGDRTGGRADHNWDQKQKKEIRTQLARKLAKTHWQKNPKLSVTNVIKRVIPEMKAKKDPWGETNIRIAIRNLDPKNSSTP